MARVFLSHASPDKPAARRIGEALRLAGHQPWLDEQEILVGESIPAAVERGLRAADFVVMCLSRAAAERGWVEAERDATLMQQFSQRKERVLPVRLEDVHRLISSHRWRRRASGGRVDAASLGTSLHQVGYCYASVGKFAEALPWFDRAVAAAEKGDVHGRVDAESLGATHEALDHALKASVKK